MAYKIMIKPAEYKKRWLWRNKTKYNKKGQTEPTLAKAKARVKKLKSLYRDDFKYKKM